jgi:putative molybdopterin biosynthesis protein
MGNSRVRSGLRERRVRAGLQQRDLARQVGVSRQTLSSLEAGETVPSTALALELAAVLGCRVEEIFWLSGGDAPLDVAVVTGGPSPRAGRRVAIGSVGERWVGHLIEGDAEFPQPADGIVGGRGRGKGAVRVRALRQSEALRQNLLAAGCDPALGLLGGHLGERFPAGKLHWVPAGSTAALEMLARGEVHLAGLHLYDEASGQYNVAAVRRRFPGQPMVMINLAVWQLGLVVKAGNPRRIRGVADLGRRGVRVMGRESGSGAEELLARRLAEEGVPRKAVNQVAVAAGHAAVAAAVAAGVADTGVATRVAAESRGLLLLPLAEARFDLVVPAHAAEDPRVERLREVLGSDRFRRDLGSVTGYGTARTGATIAEVA